MTTNRINIIQIEAEKKNKKNHNQMYETFKTLLPPLYITNHQLHEIQQPHGSQMNEILNNIFPYGTQKVGNTVQKKSNSLHNYFY